MQKLLLSALYSLAAWAPKYNFTPDSADSWHTPNIPTLYNLSSSQFQPAPISSYYAASFLTTTTGAQYLTISHLLLLPTATSTRHSLLSLTPPLPYHPTSALFPPLNLSSSSSGPWSLALPNHTFSSPSPDSVSRMRTTAVGESYAFDLRFDATSTALHALGAGTFAMRTGNNSQWSLPACRTSGALTVDGEALQVDPARSLTWYDRQWGFVDAPPVFTWMGLRFPASGTSLSIWALEHDEGGVWQFATVQTAKGVWIVEVEVREEGEMWRSPVTGKAYASRWVVGFPGGEEVVVEAVRPDQELGTGISAFVRVGGRFGGEEVVGGFGVVDVLG